MKKILIISLVFFCSLFVGCVNEKTESNLTNEEIEKGSLSLELKNFQQVNDKLINKEKLNDLITDMKKQKELELKESRAKEKKNFASKLGGLNDRNQALYLKYISEDFSNGEYSLALEELESKYESLEIEMVKYLKSNLAETKVKELTNEELLFTNELARKVNEIRGEFAGGSGGGISIAIAKIECYQGRCDRLLSYYF